MEKRIIQTTIPLSPSEINEYCRANASGNNDIIFKFDLKDCSLKPAHILGYLSNLKIDFLVTNFTTEFLVEYMKTPFLVGRSNLSQLHADVLLAKAHVQTLEDPDMWSSSILKAIPDSVIEHQMDVIRSLPLFLIESSDAPGPVKNPIVGETQHEVGGPVEGVGVNFVHLIEHDEVLLSLVSDTLLDFNRSYYTYYFDEYIYGGDRLIQFFIDNPTNMLHAVVESFLSR